MTVDDYVRTFPPEVRTILEDIRRTVREAVPGAAETISYQMPTFTVGGRRFVHFAAYKHHIGFYPAPSGPEEFEEAIAPYRAGKATVRFPLDQPVPHDLLRRMVQLLVQDTRRDEAP